MNRHSWRVIAGAVVVAVALAGQSWAGGAGPRKPPTEQYKGPVNPDVTTHLWKLKVLNVKFVQQGNPANGHTEQTNDMNVSNVWPDSFKVIVTVENSGTVQFPAAGTVKLRATGGQKVGTYDHSFNKTLTLPIPDIPAKKTVPLVFDLSPTKADEGPYYFRADLTAPQ